MYKLVVPALALLFFFSSCEKEVVVINENEPCKNLDLFVNDSIIALVTQQRISDSKPEIVKFENGIKTVVASESGAEFWGVSISPDRQKFICFKSPTGNSVGFEDFENADLWLFNIDGSNGHKITGRSEQGLRSMGMASWAPDGNHIVFSGEKLETDGNFHWNIYLTDSSGIMATRMNTRLGHFVYPRFTKNSMNYLTYSAWPVGITLSGGNFKCEIHYAGVDAFYQLMTEYQITTNVQYETSPDFSADDNSIVYTQTTSTAPNTIVNLHKYNISSGSTSSLLENSSINTYSVWCKLNNRIYYISKSSSHCHQKTGRIEESGSTIETPYQLLNTNLLQIDVK